MNFKQSNRQQTNTTTIDLKANLCLTSNEMAPLCVQVFASVLSTKLARVQCNRWQITPYLDTIPKMELCPLLSQIHSNTHHIYSWECNQINRILASTSANNRNVPTQLLLSTGPQNMCMYIPLHWAKVRRKNGGKNAVSWLIIISNSKWLKAEY